jgi:hypothetical protein
VVIHCGDKGMDTDLVFASGACTGDPLLDDQLAIAKAISQPITITDDLVERCAIAQWDSIGGHIPAVEYMKINPEGWKGTLKFIRAGLEAVLKPCR